MSCTSAVDFNNCSDVLNVDNHQDTISMDEESSLITSDDSVKTSDICDNCQNNSSSDNAVETSDIADESETDENQNVTYFNGESYLELLYKVVCSNSGDKIVVLDNFTMRSVCEVPIKHPITIDGKGFTLKRVRFMIYSESVTLKNICFENASPAIVMASDVNSTIKNCTFNNCGDDNIMSLVDYDRKFNIKVPKPTVKFNGTTFTELREQIKNLNDGDTLILENDVYQDTKEDIKIQKQITIDGNDHTLDGKHLYRMFEVSSDNAVLKNINFINGISTIKWNGKKGTVSGCTFRNIKGYDGGAIEWYGISGVIKNCNFINIKGRDGGAIHLFKQYCEVRECTFKNCVAENSGGVIFVGGSLCNVIESTFENCVAENSGGAIYILGDSCEIDGCTFQYCTAFYNGGAVFVSNYAFTSEVKNSILENNRASNGGAIYWASSCGNIVASKFERNVAEKSGGAIYISGDYCEVKKNSFGYNSALDDASAICVSGSVDKLKVYDCDFYKNCGKYVVSFVSNHRTLYTELDIKRSNFYFNDAPYTIFARNVAHFYILNCAFFKNMGLNLCHDDCYQAHAAWCWFGNTKSNPNTNMVKEDHPGKIKATDSWYVLGDDFTTSDTMIYQKYKVSFKRLSHVKSCDLRLNRDLLVKLISEN